VGWSADKKKKNSFEKYSHSMTVAGREEVVAGLQKCPKEQGQRPARQVPVNYQGSPLCARAGEFERPRAPPARHRSNSCTVAASAAAASAAAATTFVGLAVRRLSSQFPAAHVTSTNLGVGVLSGILVVDVSSRRKSFAAALERCVEVQAGSGSRVKGALRQGLGAVQAEHMAPDTHLSMFEAKMLGRAEFGHRSEIRQTPNTD
jgi:hypothetical protein